MSTNQWEKKEEWWKYGKGFLVTIKHYTEEPSTLWDEGPHRWNVYAYIYPSHPKFKEFTGEDMHQPATEGMHFHGGVSYCRQHVLPDGTVSAYQVGSDYHHLHDDHYTRCATLEDAASVVQDAEVLYAYLEKLT